MCACTHVTYSSAAREKSGADLPNAPTRSSDWRRYFEILDQTAAAYQIADPELVEVRRWILPEDADEYRNRCVPGRGFHRNDAEVWTDVSPARRSWFRDAMYVCAAQYPVIPRNTVVLRHKNLAILYEWLTQTEIPCLEREGYPTAKPPLKREFIASYGKTELFSPYVGISNVAPAELLRLNKLCPQFPPAPLLYGT